MLIIAILAIVLGCSIKKADPKKAPKGLALVAEIAVTFVDNQIKDNLGTVYQRFTPYMVFLYAYIPIAFVIGLLGLPSPMTYFTIPL
jgi:F-type H+-transporting ATPase subunit a